MNDIIIYILAYIAATALLGYLLYDYAQGKIRRNFNATVSTLLERDIDESKTVQLIYEAAYQYKQPADSVKAAITSHLSKSASTLDSDKAERILKIIHESSELSAILGLPDDVISSAKEILNKFPESRKDLVIISSHIRLLTINLSKRDLLYQKLRFATVATSTAVALWKSRQSIANLLQSIF